MHYRKREVAGVPKEATFNMGKWKNNKKPEQNCS